MGNINDELNYNDPHIIAMNILQVLNELSKTAINFNLTGTIKYTHSGCNVDEWDKAIDYLNEVCLINGYSKNAHIVELKKDYNVYLLLD